ncbi:kinetochore protein sos7 [Anaeramoeba ignava]|uniref:Kinetochore protein sos7 n=1 Tax=Anaeramoeba ignava TaxID=1746090 RepID=A0A9Q0LFK8_ANAIG|nr:kinetochore protein sos7 [Anaeramoeba ignava]
MNEKKIIKNKKEWIKQFQKGIEEIEINSLKFTEMLKQMNENTTGMINYFTELERIKNQFSKLKFTFLELATKKEFFEKLISFKNISEIEKEIEKQNLKENLQENEDLKEKKEKSKQKKEINKKNLEELMDKFASSYERVNQIREESMEKIKEIKQIFENQKEINKMKEIIEKKNEEITKQKQEIERIQEEIELIQNDLIDLQRKFAPNQKTLDNISEKVKQIKYINEWYKQMNQTFSNISGIYILETIIDQNQNQNQNQILKLKIKVYNEKNEYIDYLIDLEFIKDKIIRIEIEPNNFPNQDIIEYSKEKNDLNFLIREIRNRIINYQKTKQEIEELNQKYDIQLIQNENQDQQQILQVKIGEMILKLIIEQDYPNEYSSIHLKETNFELSPFLKESLFDKPGIKLSEILDKINFKK